MLPLLDDGWRSETLSKLPLTMDERDRLGAVAASVFSSTGMAYLQRTVAALDVNSFTVVDEEQRFQGVGKLPPPSPLVAILSMLVAISPLPRCSCVQSFMQPKCCAKLPSEETNNSCDAFHSQGLRNFHSLHRYFPSSKETPKVRPISIPGAFCNDKEAHAMHQNFQFAVRRILLFLPM